MRNINEVLKNNVNKDLISIYSHKYEGEEEKFFSVGIIENITLDDILIHCIDSYGYEDGWFFSSISNIYKVEIDNEYLDKMKKIYKARNLKLKKFFEDKIYEKEDLRLKFLKKVMLSNYLIRFSVSDNYQDDVVGKIIDIDNHILTVYCYDYFDGSFIKNSVFIFDDIKRIHCCTKELETINLLID